MRTKVVGIFHIISLFFLVIGVMLTISAVRQEQNLRQEAAKLKKQREQQNTIKEKHVPGELIVKLKPQAAISAASAKAAEDRMIKQHKAHVLDRIDKLGVRKIYVPQGKEQEIMAALSKDPGVEYVEQNAYVFGGSIPNDPEFKRQWALHNTGQTGGEEDADIDAPEAWDVSKGSSDVVVAVLDTGIDPNHPDIPSSKIIKKENFSTELNTDDNNGHGTHIAGIIAAETNNGKGVAGICQKCKLLIGKVLDKDEAGDAATIAKAIEWAVDNGANVINLSLATKVDVQALRDAIDAAINKNVVVVAIAGNCGDGNFSQNHCDEKNQILYPGAYDEVISVAATDANDKKASFSNSGERIDVAAPGASIFSTWLTSKGGYNLAQGTSMAAPMVAGIAGLILSENKDMSTKEVIYKIQNSADKIDGTGEFWKYGRVNAANALGAKSSDCPPELTDEDCQPEKEEPNPTDKIPQSERPQTTPGDDGNVPQNPPPGTGQPPATPTLFVCLGLPNCGQTGTPTIGTPSLTPGDGDVPPGTPTPDWLTLLQERLAEMRQRLQEAGEELRQRMEEVRNRLLQIGEQVRERTQNPNVPNRPVITPRTTTRTP